MCSEVVTKTYKNFGIAPRALGTWLNVYKDGEFFVSVPNEEEARRVIWLNCGKGEAITEDMMEVVVHV
jgi:hypothetical protein